MERLTGHQQRISENRLGSRVVDRLQRKQHVGCRKGRAVGERDTLAKSNAERALVGQQFPPFGELRLERVGGSIDTDQARVHQVGQHHGRLIARDQPIERARFCADRGDDPAAAGKVRLHRRAVAPGDDAGAHADAEDCDGSEETCAHASLIG
jgi:hypothetical protein